MSKLIIPAPAVVTLPIANTDKEFPVRRVYCIGRNYAAHAVEMGHDPDREAPFFFQKNPDNLNTTGTFPYPVKTSDVHYEIEMAIMLKSGGCNISTSDALNHVFGYALSLDMTRRDLQATQKKMGRPWEIAKAFEQSAPVGKIHTAESVGHLDAGRLELKVNDEIKQEGDLNQMIWKVPEIIAYLSDYFELAAGDVILSGTPAGVGPIAKGDTMQVSIEGLGSMNISVVN